MKKCCLIFSLLLWSLPALHAQTQLDLRTQSKSVDLSGAAYTIPARTGIVLPSTCLLGEVFFKSNGPAGQNIYGCAPVNTWTVQAGVTVVATTNLLAGDNLGNAINSGISSSSVVTLTGTQTLTNKSIASGQITGLAPSATLDTTNGSNITSGTISAARLPSLGGDLAGTVASASVSKVNGASLPSSQPCLGTNSTSQIVAGACGTGGGATIAPVTNLIAGSGAGNGVDSGISPLSVVTVAGSQTLTNKNIAAAQITGVLGTAAGGNGTATPSLIAGPNVTITGSWPNQTIMASSTAATAFSALTGSTNSSAALVVGSGASLAASGTGTIAATSVPASGVNGILGVANGGTGTAAGIPVQSVAGRTGAITLSTADIAGYAGAVNADWNATSGLAQILNKPNVNNATSVNGLAVPASQACVGSNGSSQIVAGSCLSASNNLSDLASAATARSNLGLGSAATLGSGSFDVSGAAATVQAASVQKASNLSDLASPSTARTNLGLTSAATASLPLSLANGGTGLTAASLVAGSHVTVSGTWPNQTVSAVVPTVPPTTNLLAGDNLGNAINSGVATTSLVTLAGTQTLLNKSISAVQITGLSNSATTDTTNAANISSGTLSASRLPLPTSTTLGGTQSLTATAHNYLTGISTAGVPAAAQPSFSDIAGIVSVGAGGTGTTSPSLVAGSNVSISGAWPNQTISASAGGGGGSGLNPPAAGSGLLIGSAASFATSVGTPGVDFQSPTSISAANYGDHSSTGIQSAVAACGSVTSCSIVAPPTYGAVENRPCVWNNVGQPFSTDGCRYPMPPNVTFFDYRNGIYAQNVDSGGIYPASNYQAWQRLDYITAAPLALNNPNLYFSNKVASSINLLALGGGVNINNTNYPNKTTYIGQDLRLHGYTPGQKLGYESLVNSYSLGDALGYYAITTCYGGFNAGSDEGCEAMDIQATQGTVEYSGTVTGTSSNTVSIAATIGDGTQGEGRFLVDASQAYTTGTISSIGTNGPITLTGANTGWPVSTVNTTTGTLIAAPGQATVTVANVAGITTSTTVCMADNFEIEQVIPTAVSNGGFTANFRYPHPAGTIVSVGGLACHYIALTADIASPATFNALAYPLQMPLHWVVPIIRSTSSTSLDLWLQCPDVGWVGYRGRWTAANAGYAIYPGAQVTSVMQNQRLSSTLTVEVPVNFANGDSVILPMYHNLNVYEALHSVQRVFPQVGGGNPAAWWMQLHGLWTDADTAMEVDNNTPASVYTGGKSKPIFMHPKGNWDSLLYLDSQPANVIRSQDPTVATNIILQSSNLGYAYLSSDPVNHQWAMANYFNGSYILFDWQAGNIQTTGKISASAYVTTELETGKTTNTDVAGFITLASGSGSYSFTGGYANSPVCTASDNSAVSAVRVQTTASTLTVTGTGSDVISYVCVARF